MINWEFFNIIKCVFFDLFFDFVFILLNFNLFGGWLGSGEIIFVEVVCFFIFNFEVEVVMGLFGGWLGSGGIGVGFSFVFWFFFLVEEWVKVIFKDNGLMRLWFLLNFNWFFKFVLV